jgi:hypothetical protein
MHLHHTPCLYHYPEEGRIIDFFCSLAYLCTTYRSHFSFFVYGQQQADATATKKENNYHYLEERPDRIDFFVN